MEEGGCLTSVGKWERPKGFLFHCLLNHFSVDWLRLVGGATWVRILTFDLCSTNGANPIESALWCREAGWDVLGRAVSSFSLSDWEGGLGRYEVGAVCTKRGAPNGSGLHTGGFPRLAAGMTSLVTLLDKTYVGCLEEKVSSNPPIVCGAWGFVWGFVVAMETSGSSEAMKKSSLLVCKARRRGWEV